MHENVLFLSHHQTYLNMMTFQKKKLGFPTPIIVDKNNIPFGYPKKTKEKFSR
jgi:hypothetical protein